MVILAQVDLQIYFRKNKELDCSKPAGSHHDLVNVYLWYVFNIILQSKPQAPSLQIFYAILGMYFSWQYILQCTHFENII
jgi:hypothetical protein